MQGLCKKCTVHWLTAIQWSPMGHQSSLLDCPSAQSPEEQQSTPPVTVRICERAGKEAQQGTQRERGREQGLGG